MNKLTIMFKLIYRSMKLHKRILKLQNIQSKLLDEMKLQLELHEKDIEILETKMKNLLNE